MADSATQLQTLYGEVADRLKLPLFHEKLSDSALFPLLVLEPTVLQINADKTCRQVLDYLIASNNYDGYMEKLVNAYNPAVATGVICRTTLSVIGTAACTTAISIRCST